MKYRPLTFGSRIFLAEAKWRALKARPTSFDRPYVIRPCDRNARRLTPAKKTHFQKSPNPTERRPGHHHHAKGPASLSNRRSGWNI